LGSTRHGEFGFRLAVGTILGHAYENPGVFNNAQGSPLHFGYFAGSFHYTYRQYTGFLQLNSATKATDLLLGLNYRFWAGRKRK
jgi:hypothetical protein